eukprot:116339-Hanusia_phi.AAC.3
MMRMTRMRMRMRMTRMRIRMRMRMRMKRRRRRRMRWSGDGDGGGGLVKELMSALVAQQLMTRGGIVDLDVTEEQVQNLPVSHDLQEELRRRSDDIVSVLHKSCYNNIFALLQHNLSEDMYLQIVRNRILVDIQGGDVLLQIFTCKILQTSPGQEAPFLEFIERVCKV